MKISNVSTMVRGTPWRNFSSVKVETDDGLDDWAEARPVGGGGLVIDHLNKTVSDFNPFSDDWHRRDLK